MSLLDRLKRLLRMEIGPVFSTREEYMAWKAAQLSRSTRQEREAVAPLPPPGAVSQRPNVEWQLGPATCPYCRAQFDQFPKRKRKCPSCGNVVVIWRDEKRRERTLVTQAEAASREAEWAAEVTANSEAAAPGIFLRRIRRMVRSGDLTDGEILAHRTSAASEGDATWALFQLALQREMERSDFATLGDLYHSMALFLDKEGRDFTSALKEAYRSDLRALEREARSSDGVITGVTITGGACDACRSIEGRCFTFAEARRTNPLPCERCSMTMYSEREGFCRCMYSPTLD